MMISESDIVISLNGRDEGKHFFVLGIEEEYVLLANGKGRRIERPKRKKLKHVQFVAKPDCRVSEKIRNNEKISNSDLRRALAQYEAGSCGDQGGM
ncbi:MAG: KOW domain-containing RNA-binding protein [Oscillospiraceae bacterium]|nr:KOW domain-containing RNA-binding protein [Oscillospiraceae bacterium]